jgi:hypothetical protein
MSVTNNVTPFPGHGMLLGPEQFSLGKTPQGRDMLLRNAEDYRLWHSIIVATKQGKIWRSPEAVKVYINFGKWVADCHWCKKGMLTRPDWAFAGCTECGAYYEGELLAFPTDPRIVEALLARPSRDTQHWDDLQTADDLIRENKEILKL